MRSRLIVLIIIVLSGAALLQPAHGAGASSFASSDVQVTPSAAEDRDEPSVAINPTDPRNVIIVAQDWNAPNVWPGTRGLSTFVSRDGGMTWSDEGFVDLRAASGSELSFAYDPSLAFDGAGRAYLSYIVRGFSKGARSGLVVTRSDDGGATWGAPVFLEQRFRDGTTCVSQDKNWTATDPASGTIYVTWSRYMSDCSASTFTTTRPLKHPVYFSRSTDAGTTWTAPQRLSEPGHDWGQGSRPRVGPDGTLYVAYLDLIPLVDAPTECPSVWSVNSKDPRVGRIVVATSRDDGTTWGYHGVGYICDTFPLTEDYQAIPGYPSLAIDASTNTAYVAWSAKRGSDRRAKVHVSSSTDGGEVWSPPRILPSRFGDADYFPEVGAGDGTAWLFYLGVQPGTSRYDAYIRSSQDHGASWSEPNRLSTVTSTDCNDLTNPSAPGQRFIGHYMGLDVLGDAVVPAWVACHDPNDNSQDMFTRPALPSILQTNVGFTTGSAKSGQYSDDVPVEAALHDEDGNPLAGHELTFELAGGDGSTSAVATTDAHGVASTTMTLDQHPGSYELTARFAGDDQRYEPSNATTAFTIDREDTSTKLTVDGRGSNRTLTARLNDADAESRGIGGRTIEFFADGQSIGSGTTSEEGVASLQVPPRYRGGSHEFNAVFAGDDFYTASSDTRITTADESGGQQQGTRSRSVFVPI